MPLKIECSFTDIYDTNDYQYNIPLKTSPMIVDKGTGKPSQPDNPTHTRIETLRAVKR